MLGVSKAVNTSTRAESTNHAKVQVRERLMNSFLSKLQSHLNTLSLQFELFSEAIHPKVPDAFMSLFTFRCQCCDCSVKIPGCAQIQEAVCWYNESV